MAITGLFQYLKDVRAEAFKVTWASRKESTTMTVVVLVIVALSALFFFLVDQIIRWGLYFVLGLGR